MNTDIDNDGINDGPDGDRVAGGLKNIGGKIEAGVGHLIGDAKMEAEGKAKQVEGKVQNSYGGAKDAVRDAVR